MKKNKYTGSKASDFFKNKKEKITFEVSLKDFKKLKQLAKLADVSLNDFISTIIVLHLHKLGALNEK